MRNWVTFDTIRAMTDYETRDLTRQVAGIIRAAMAKHNVTQTEMAVAVGVDQSHLSKMVRGMKPISIDQLAAMAWALDLDVSQIIRDAEDALKDYMIPAAAPVRYVSDGIRNEAPEDDRDWWASKAITPVAAPRRRGA